MRIENKDKILQRRKEIEQEFSEMLRETKSDLDFDGIKQIIYNEDGQGGLADIIAMFDTGQGRSGISKYA